MGLDIYCGPLGRYWSGNWSLRANIDKSTSSKIDDSVMDEEAHALLDEVRDWRDRLNLEYASQLGGTVDWQESLTGPYLTDKPGWDPFSALGLWAGMEERGLRKYPWEMPFSAHEEPGYDALQEKGSRYQDFIATLWLPRDGFETFAGPWIEGENQWFGSTYRFFSALQELNQRTWQADTTTIDAWYRGDPESLAPNLDEAKRQSLADGSDLFDAVMNTFEGNARFAFGIVYKLARYAAASGLPMKTDW